MSILPKNIRYLRKANGWSQDYIAEKLGYKSYTTIQKWEMGTSEPPLKKTRELADLFHVDIDDLTNKDLEIPDVIKSQYNNDVSLEEITVIKKYRDLDDHGKEMVDFTLQKEWERSAATNQSDAEASIHNTPLRLINYYYRLASAGTGQIIFDMPPTKRIEIPNTPEYRKVDYAIGVNGNSMEPTFYDGDMLLIEMTEEIDPGEIGIFLVDNESYVKKLGKGELISLNPECDNIPLTEDSRCMGRVIDKLENS